MKTPVSTSSSVFISLLQRPLLLVLGLLVLGLNVLCVSPVWSASLIPAAPELAASSFLLMDTDTGTVLAEHNADEQLPPASLTKMMTSYIVAGELERGTMAEADLVTVSEKAWRKGGSKMFIEVNTQVSIGDLMRGVIVQSGNDASIALAEATAGSEEAFVDMMNQQAAMLGMNNTHFENATGWPAEGHLTTARDLGKLAQAVINDHPDHYALYAEKYFTYNNIKQPNRNRLLWRDESVDGIKTGHTDEAGFCLVASAQKNEMRLVSVVMGTRSDEARAAESQKLLAWGFRFFEGLELYSAGQSLKQQRVWGGLQEQVNLGTANAIRLTVPRNSKQQLQAEVELDKVLKAPITEGQVIGTLKITLADDVLLTQPLVALHAVPEAGLFKRLLDDAKLFIEQSLGK